MSVKDVPVEPVGPESADDDLAVGLPPGPPLPAWAQTLAFILAGRRFLAACERHYGAAVTLSTVFDRSFVMIFDPALVKELSEPVKVGETLSVGI